jgi:dienelactone hydrolase
MDLRSTATRRGFLVAGAAAAIGAARARQDTEPNPRFSTIEYLRRYYRESRAALEVPESPAELPAWRERVVRRLRAVLGLDACTPAPLGPKIDPVGARQGYRIERVVFTSEPYADVPGLVLIPDGVSEQHKAPAVLCLHGNVPGAKNEVAAETADPKAREGLALYQDGYARDLARRGFVAFAIDLRDSGERVHREPYRGAPVMPREGDLDSERWRQVASMMAIPAGRTYLGLCVFDAIRALDYLVGRREVDLEKVGCVGFSAGGTLGAWLAVLDRRVRVLGVSGTSIATRRESAASMHTRRPAGLLPGFYVDLDADLCLAAVAPTPMVFARDVPGSPRPDAPEVPSIRRAYEGWNAAADLRIVFGRRRGHVWHGDDVLPWFEERLRRAGAQR